jgi:hypothetical protein
MAVEDIQFRITKDSNGEDISLDNLSINATNSLIEILTALRNIAIYENKPDLTIGVKRGSACASINGYEGLQVVRDGFWKVFNNDDDRNNVYVNNMQIIKDQIKKSDLEFEVSFLEDEDRVQVIDLFERKFRKRRERKAVENNFKIEFFNAKLMSNGGNKPNFHVMDKQYPYTISCSVEEAKKVSPFLYENLRFSAWGKINSNNKMEYTFCDIYNANERDFYSEFKIFFTEMKTLEGTEPIKRIHYKLKEFYSNHQYKESRKFIKLFCNDFADINHLTAILIISKAFKEHDDLKDLLKKIENLIVSKTNTRLL